MISVLKPSAVEVAGDHLFSFKV